VDPATYLADHTVAPGVQVLGPMTDPLSNGGDTVTLLMPGSPEPEFVPYIEVETIKYNDRYPWPAEADGNGPALSRLVSGDYGNAPANWGVSGGPIVTVDPLTTGDTTPELTGTVTDARPPATVTVTVDGNDYVVPASGGTWTLADNTIAPALGDGTYDVSVTASDIVGNTGSDTTVDELVVELVLGVVGRHVFYNNSIWDGDDPLPNPADDAAIATDKQPLLPGGTVAPENHTSYSRGINGIMVDIDDLPGNPTAADFTFEVNAAENPDTWTPAPAPTSVTVRPGEGVNGKDRVTIIWADGAIQNQWLRVTVLPTAETGLASEDVFLYGNAVGDTDSDGQVDSTDYGTTIDQFGRTGGIGTFQADFNGDSVVGFGDFALVRANYGVSVAPPTPPTAPAAAVASPPTSENGDWLRSAAEVPVPIFASGSVGDGQRGQAPSSFGPFDALPSANSGSSDRTTEPVPFVLTESQPVVAGSTAATLYQAATAAENAPYGADDPLSDILAESPVTMPL